MDVALTWVGGEGAVVRMWLRAEAALRHQSAAMQAPASASAALAASAAAVRDGTARRGGTHLCKVAAPECDGLLLGHRAVAVGVHLIEEALVRVARARVRVSHYVGSRFYLLETLRRRRLACASSTRSPHTSRDCVSAAHRSSMFACACVVHGVRAGWVWRVYVWRRRLEHGLHLR